MLKKRQTERWDLMTKYGLPIGTVRWADCDSRTSIYGCRHFVEGEDVMSCRWAAPALLFPSHPPSQPWWETKVELCFPNVTAFENGEQVMIKVERRSKWQHSVFRSDSLVSNWNGFFLNIFGGGWGGLCVVISLLLFIFYLERNTTGGSVVQWVRRFLIPYVVCV